MSTSSYKPQKGRGLPWPLDTDAPSVADQAETPSEMEAALDVRQDEIAKSEILSGINRHPTTHYLRSRRIASSLRF